MTAGSVGARAAPIRPLVIQEVEDDVRGDRDQTGRGEGPDQAERQDRAGGRAEAAPADVEAAVEEDHDERDDADPLDGDERDLLPELGTRSEAAAAATRKIAALGIATRCVIAWPKSASETTDATTRTITPKSEISVTG